MVIIKETTNLETIGIRKKEMCCLKNFAKTSSYSAQMTIYLTLVLAVLIPLLMMMIDGARNSACKSTLEAVTEMGMDSILAEYHKELLDRYGLLLIDTSYGEMSGSLDNTKEHLKSYMMYNLHPKKDLLSAIGSRDLLGLDVEGIDFISASRATDGKGEVFRYLACQYMLEKVGISYLETMGDLDTEYANFELYSGKNDNPMKELMEAQKSIDQLTVTKPEDAGEDWEEPEKDQPAQEVTSVNRSGILKKVCSGSISGASANLDVYASKRDLVAGSGMNPAWKESLEFAEAFFFNEYLLTMMGYYGQEREDSLLQYQIEYIIAGKDNDKENLKKIAWQIFGMRVLINSGLISKSAARVEKIKTMAWGMAFVTFSPEAKPAYEELLKTAWIVAESLCDVKKLMHGKKIPLDKKSDEWETSLWEGLSLNLKIGSDEGRGMDYKDYLRFMLLEVGIDKRTMRAMDIVEMDIRRITGNNDFRLDNCIAGGEVQYIFTNIYGNAFLMKRKFSYY